MTITNARSCVPPLGDSCQVWWASITDARPEHEAVLDDNELGRRARFARRQDRDRFIVGSALARIVLGCHLCCAPSAVRLDRSCSICSEPHGKPRVMHSGALELSVSHAGGRIVVAVARAHALGVDVECVDSRARVEDLFSEVLVLEERRALAIAAEGHRGGFLRYWTRKEAILKATGDGLRVALKDLTVSAPDEPPVLRDWRGRSAMAERVSLFDLQPGEGYSASLAVLDASAGIEILELDASDLLTGDARAAQAPADVPRDCSERSEE